MASSITRSNISLRYIEHNYPRFVTLQEAVLLSGLFIAFPAGIAAVTGWYGRRRHRRGVRRTAWSVLGVAGLLALTWWLSSVVGTIPPDALDRGNHRVESAVRTAMGCHPLARVTELQVGDHELAFRCAQTVLGWPSIGHTADCVDGSWHAGGWRDPSVLGAC